MVWGSRLSEGCYFQCNGIVSCQGHLIWFHVKVTWNWRLYFGVLLKLSHVKVTWRVSCQGNLEFSHIKVTWSSVMSRLPEAVSCQGYLKRCHVKATWSSVMSRLPEVEGLLLKYHIYQQITRQVWGSNIVWQHWPDTPE